jgi:hypothetical protein
VFVSSLSRNLAEEQTETSKVGLDLREATNFCSHNRLHLEGQSVLAAIAITHVSQLTADFTGASGIYLSFP